jgi:hypothetical protein
VPVAYARTLSAVQLVCLAPVCSAVVRRRGLREIGQQIERMRLPANKGKRSAVWIAGSARTHSAWTVCIADWPSCL